MNAHYVRNNMNKNAFKQKISNSMIFWGSDADSKIALMQLKSMFRGQIPF